MIMKKSIKKIISILTVLSILGGIAAHICSYTPAYAVTACVHSYAAATCTKPQTCTKCGATTGSSLGHNSSGRSYLSKAPTCTAEGVYAFESLDWDFTTDWKMVPGYDYPQLRGLPPVGLENNVTFNQAVAILANSPAIDVPFSEPADIIAYLQEHIEALTGFIGAEVRQWEVSTGGNGKFYLMNPDGGENCGAADKHEAR